MIIDELAEFLASLPEYITGSPEELAAKLEAYEPEKDIHTKYQSLVDNIEKLIDKREKTAAEIKRLTKKQELLDKRIFKLDNERCNAAIRHRIAAESKDNPTEYYSYHPTYAGWIKIKGVTFADMKEQIREGIAVRLEQGGQPPI